MKLKQFRTTEEWVAAVNQAAREMDEWAASLHPSAWPEALADLRAQYRAIAGANVADPVIPSAPDTADLG